MSALNPPKRISKRHELRQDTVVTAYARTWDFFDQNRKLVFGAIAALVVLVLIGAGYAFYHAQQEEKAQELLGIILPVYEQGDYRAALDGTDETVGLLEIADDYGSTDAGNLARFYAADALYRLDEFDQSLRFFESFDKEENYIGASAYAAEAAIYENKENFARAADLYKQAALHAENELFSPQYLLEAGRSYERAGQYAQARQMYEMIRDRYPDSNLTSGIDFYVARLDALENAAQ